MSIWPYLPVWPFLLLGCLALSYWNWRAAVAFAACVISVKIIQALQLPFEQAAFLLMYSTAAAICAFYWDKIAGFALALIGLTYILYLLGVTSNYFKLLAVEAILVMGMLVSGFTGPSGGILARDGGGRAGGLHSPSDGVAIRSTED